MPRILESKCHSIFPAVLYFKITNNTMCLSKESIVFKIANESMTSGFACVVPILLCFYFLFLFCFCFIFILLCLDCFSSCPRCCFNMFLPLSACYAPRGICCIHLAIHLFVHSFNCIYSFHLIFIQWSDFGTTLHFSHVVAMYSQKLLD